MYFKYPYSDMYALNLDWMIKAINEVQEIIGELGVVVNSVNGESGDVTISAEMVNATDINGTMVTTTDPSTQPQSVLAAYYENGIRVILVRNNLGAIDRCFFLSKYDSVFNLVEYVPTSSQSGVRLINGLNGDVTLTGENITLSTEDQRTIAVVIAALNNRTGTLESNVGDLASLETYNKTSLVAAINELVQTDNTIFEDIGDISNLQVEAGNLVSAVNINTAGIRNLGPYNGLDSNSTTAALSAAQGKALNQQITTQTIETGIPGIIAKLNNQTVSLFLTIYNPDQSINTWITLGTLPKSLRPSVQFQTLANINVDVTPLTIRVQPNGIIDYYHFSSTPTIDRIVGLITYIL